MVDAETRRVVVIDDDQSVRAAVTDLLESVGYKVSAFPTAEAFLSAAEPEADCLVLDVRMPGAGGLELQRRLMKAGNEPAIVFITGHGDVPMCARALKAGALDFLLKPFNDQDLLDAVATGVLRSMQKRCSRAEREARSALFACLSERERDVVVRVAQGQLNKQIAGELGVSEITIKVSRAQAMRKLQVATLPDLVRLVDAVQGASNQYTKV